MVAGKSKHRLTTGIWALTICLAFIGLSGQAANGQDEEPKMAAGEFFIKKVAPVIKTKCLRCHNEKDAKGDVNFDDLEWVENLVDFESNDFFQESALSSNLLSTSPNTIMPPVGAGHLEGHQIAVFFEWFEDHEASVPEKIDWNEISDDTKIEAAPMPEDPATLAWNLTGRLHPALLHFPVALLIVAAILAIFGFGNEYTDKAAMYCLVIGTLGAIASCVSGWSFGEYKGWDWENEETMSMASIHRWGGIATAVLGTIVVMIAFISRSKENGSQFLWKFGVFVLAGLVAVVGHVGGKKSHGDYTALINKFLNAISTPQPVKPNEPIEEDKKETEQPEKTEGTDSAEKTAEDVKEKDESKSDDKKADETKAEDPKAKETKSEEDKADKKEEKSSDSKSDEKVAEEKTEATKADEVKKEESDTKKSSDKKEESKTEAKDSKSEDEKSNKEKDTESKENSSKENNDDKKDQKGETEKSENKEKSTSGEEKK